MIRRKSKSAVRRPIERTGLALGCFGFLLFAALQAPPAQENKRAANRLGVLQLTIVDADSGQPTPARVELLDQQGRSYLAGDALVIGGDCKDRPTAWNGTLDEWKATLTTKINDPQRGTNQFYTSGTSRISLPAGSYRVHVVKGTEYRVAEHKIQIAAGGAAEFKVSLSRWIDLAKEGWYSADAHLHIARPSAELNESILTWMLAEELHFSTLLQWGNPQRDHNTAQYAFGPAGIFRRGDYFLASGQENPRTNFLGHTMILGGQRPINVPDHYLVYKQFWEEAQRQGAMSGRCHFGRSVIGQNRTLAGLAIDLPDNLLRFVEIMQFDDGYYDNWYEALTLGFRLAPIAGSDYPCVRVLPGRERFFTKIDGPLSYQAWLEAVRRGRTFATNGPAIEFHVEGREIGDEITLEHPGSVLVAARVRFDPARDDVQQLEIVENGQVVYHVPRTPGASEIRCEFRHQIIEAAWLAARASGAKLGEGEHPRYKRIAPSLVHSGAIYASLAGAPGLAASRRAKLVAAKWAESLDELEKQLTVESRLPELVGRPKSNEGVDLDYLKAHRDDLLARVRTARRWYLEVARR